MVFQLMANPKPVRAVILCLSWLSLVLVFTSASDPDPVQDFCVADRTSAVSQSVNGFPCKDSKTVNALDFLFEGLRSPGSTNNTFGYDITRANVESFPALNTLGVSINRVDYAPGGLNPPHIHPRAAEIVFALKGSILVGFISTNNTFFAGVLQEGDLFVIPRGLVHFQYNVGSTNAVAITTFNSQLPGAQLVAPSLFGSTPAVPVEILAKTFQIDNNVVHQIASKFVPK